MGKGSTPAQLRAIKKHDAEKVDRVTVRLPKGTKEKIKASGLSVNAFVIAAVLEKLEKRDKSDKTS